MQKKLIALAIAGLSGAAFAQSNVTVYGVADATYDFVNVSGGATAGNNISFNRVSTNSSLIGFKGSEALGNGMTAVFQYESGVSFDAAGAFGATRDSFVGLAGGFGTVALGNLTGPTRAFGAAVDVNAGATGTGANSALLGKLGNVLTGTLNTATVTGAVTGQVTGGPAGTRSATQTSAYDTRFQNAIAYISPTMGGFTAILGYVPNEGKSDVAGTKNDASAYDFGLKYANGPILVGLSHADVKLKNSVTASTCGAGTTAFTSTTCITTAAGAATISAAPAATTTNYNTTTNITRLVGSYDFGMASVRALWEKTKAHVDNIGDIDQGVWGLGGTVNAGSGRVLAQYYRAKQVNGVAALGAGSDTGAKLAEIGYEYDMSKRTMLKASWTELKNDTNAKYDFGINSTGLAFGNAGAKLRSVQVGLRHSF